MMKISGPNSQWIECSKIKHPSQFSEMLQQKNPKEFEEIDLSTQDTIEA